MKKRCDTWPSDVPHAESSCYDTDNQGNKILFFKTATYVATCTEFGVENLHVSHQNTM